MSTKTNWSRPGLVQGLPWPWWGQAVTENGWRKGMGKLFKVFQLNNPNFNFVFWSEKTNDTSIFFSVILTFIERYIIVRRRCLTSNAYKWTVIIVDALLPAASHRFAVSANNAPEKSTFSTTEKSPFCSYFHYRSIQPVIFLINGFVALSFFPQQPRRCKTLKYSFI